MSEVKCEVCGSTCILGGDDKEGTHYYIPIDKSAALKGAIAEVFRHNKEYLQVIREELSELKEFAIPKGWRTSKRHLMAHKIMKSLNDAETKLYELMK